MLHRRVGYIAALAAAVAFQIFFVGWLSTFVLVLVILFPLFSLALSLPGMLRCTLTLSAGPGGLSRGGTGFLALALEGPGWLPLTRITARLSYHNQLTGETRTVRREVRGVVQGAGLREEFAVPHCGRLLCQIKRPRACDFLGLFALPLACADPCALLVLPEAVNLKPPLELAGAGDDDAGLRPRPGGGPGEDYDLREYRAGDPLRSVHWKLSSKLDDLVVRETMEPHRPALALTYDHFGPPEELDKTFARLCALSRALLALGRPHQIRWADPATGALCGGAVEQEQDLYACLGLAFSTPAPLEGKSILDIPFQAPDGGLMRRFHVFPDDLEGGAV